MLRTEGDRKGNVRFATTEAAAQGWGISHRVQRSPTLGQQVRAGAVPSASASGKILPMLKTDRPCPQHPAFRQALEASSDRDQGLDWKSEVTGRAGMGLTLLSSRKEAWGGPCLLSTHCLRRYPSLCQRAACSLRLVHLSPSLKFCLCVSVSLCLPVSFSQSVFLLVSP